MLRLGAVPVAAFASAALLLPSTAGAVTFAGREVPVDPTPRAVAVGDFDGNGDLDLVSANVDPRGQSDGSVSVLPGDGDGGFGPRRSFPVGRDPFSAAVGDVDGDGDLDLVVTNSLGRSVSVLLGDGSGGLGPKRDFATGINPVSVAMTDFDGDGDLDMAVANDHDDSAPDRDTVSVLPGDGSGGFGPKRDLVAGDDDPRSVAVGDFDRDGDADLVTASAGAASVSVFSGDGAGGFAPRRNFATSLVPWSIAVGDFDRDGNPDVVTGNLQSTVSVLLGDGAGGFGPRRDFTAGESPESVAVGDFDGDRAPDVAAANSSSNSVSVLLGDGSGGLATKQDFATGVAPRDLAVGDFNGDGDADLTTANVAADTASVLLNTSLPVVDVRPASVAFPGTPVGSSSAPQEVTVENRGEGGLEVSEIAVEGADAAQFAVGEETCTQRSVRPGERCTIAVRFRPTRAGAASATLRIVDNAADSPQRVALSGTGTRPAFSVDPSKLVFVNEIVGGTSASQRVTVTNAGTGPLAIASTGIQGDHPRDYVIKADSCAGQTVAAGGTCAVRVAFRPTRHGRRAGSLVFADNAPGGPHSVGLVGRGCIIIIAGPLCI